MAPQQFDTPNDVVELLDSSSRPESVSELRRKQAKRPKVRTDAYKLDTVAKWQLWVSALGIRLLGLRIFA